MTTADRAPHSRITFVLVSVVVVFAILNTVLMGLWTDDKSNVRNAILYSLLAFEPISFAVWTALGIGSMLKRFPLAIPCLILIFIAPAFVPSVAADLRQKEFAILVLMGIAIYVATVLLMLLFHRFTGFSLQPTHADNAGIRFSVRGLFVLMTIYAAVMGLTAQLKLRTGPSQYEWILGSNYYLAVAAQMSALFFAVVLPTIAIPLSILRGRPTRRAAALAIAFWFAVSLLVVVLVGAGTAFFEPLGAILSMQLIAGILGALTAIAFRCCGYRLTRSQRELSVQPPHNSS